MSKKASETLGPFVAAMYTVTAQEVEQWKENKLVSFDEDTKNAPLITYPWLFGRELGKIATRQSGPSEMRAMLTANGDVRRREPVKKSNYKAELRSVKLEPLQEWKPEYAVVGDHVGKTAFDVASAEGLEKGIHVAGENDEAVDEMPKETTKVTVEEMNDEDAVNGADEMEAADTEGMAQEDMEPQRSEDATEEECAEEQISDREESGEGEPEEEGAKETGFEEERAEEGPGKVGGEEEEAKKEVVEEEPENALDLLLAMTS
jgi:hypothetical protein